MIGVIGSTGLLGSCLTRMYDVVPLVCDITKFQSVWGAVRSVDTVINCAGIVDYYAPKETLYKVNAVGPHTLQMVCDAQGKRLVHISTDCVFSGKCGYYTEADNIDCESTYGITKYLGEISDKPHLTLRCSFVGLPDPKGHGLLHWFVNRSEVDGYEYVFWNGLTTVELSRLIMQVAENRDITGIAHVFGPDRISKYELLNTVAAVYKLDVQINPANPYRHDRSLSTVRNDIILPDKSFREMVEEMRELNG